MRFASTAYRTIGNRWRQLAPAANLCRRYRREQGRAVCISAARCSLPIIRCRRRSLPARSRSAVSSRSGRPSTRISRWRGRRHFRGGELPKAYYDAMDPFVVLAAASEATKRIKLGTGVALIQQRDVIQTAKLVASIDQVSRGRFLFGVGGGWNQDEMEDHGTVYATRFKRLRESIEAMKEIWTKERAEYHGEFVNFDPMIARPKPVQKPHPPIHVGGAFPHGARRAIRYGDGWIPGGDVREVLPKFREMAREADRDPAGIEITSFALGEDPDRVKRLNEMGVARVVPMFPTEKADTVMHIVVRWTNVMRQVHG